MAVTHVHDIKSLLGLLIPDSIQKIILDMTNLEGRQWKEMDNTHLRAYFGILILAGVYRSRWVNCKSLGY